MSGNFVVSLVLGLLLQVDPFNFWVDVISAARVSPLACPHPRDFNAPGRFLRRLRRHPSSSCGFGSPSSVDAVTGPCDPAGPPVLLGSVSGVSRGLGTFDETLRRATGPF